MPSVEMPNEYIGAARSMCSASHAAPRALPTAGAREARCAATLRRGLVSAWRPWFHRAGLFTYSRCPSYRTRGIAPVWRRRDARRSDFVERLLLTLSRDSPPTYWDYSAAPARRRDLGPVQPRTPRPRPPHSDRDPACIRPRWVL